MPDSALLDVVLRAADDREFRETLIADPDSIERTYRLDREEQMVIRGMVKYSFVPGRTTAFDRVEFSDLLSVFMKLAINDSLSQPDVYRRLGEIVEKLKDKANDIEIERLEAIVEKRDAAEACEQSLKALAYVILMIMVIVLLELLFAGPDDPPD